MAAEAFHQLISTLFYRYFGNDLLLEGGDSAVFATQNGRMAFTDSYVISPVFFRAVILVSLQFAGRLMIWRLAVPCLVI